MASGVDARGTGGSGGALTGIDGALSAGGSGGLDAGIDGPRLGACSPMPRCSPYEILVRVQIPALGTQGCTCAANPCGTGLPDCNCAANLCAALSGSTCVGYMPDSGALVCAEPG